MRRQIPKESFRIDGINEQPNKTWEECKEKVMEVIK